MDVMKCPHCGAVYSVDVIKERDYEDEFDYASGDWFRYKWHWCQCCGEPIEEDPELIDPPVEQMDPDALIYEEVEREIAREYDRMRL